MSLFQSPFVRKYLIPGAVFQSVLVGGGYGTGREIVEYFTRFGAGGGVLGLGVTVVCWFLVLAVTWEFARVFAVYDYRSFFRRLLGRGWVLFEVLFILMFLIVLAVVASAAGEILLDSFGIPYLIGITAMLALVGVLAFFGREVITRVLATWSAVLYGMFLFYFVTVFLRSGADMADQIGAWEMVSGWGVSGFKYAMYNVFIVPAILFSTRDFESRREVAGSALAAALLCAFPALLFHLSFLGDYPAILVREIPVYAVITSLGVGALLAVYLVALFGTLVETGAGFIQGTIERIDAVRLEAKAPPLSPVFRGVLAVGAIGLSASLATFGIIALIARGYGMLAWGAFAVYVLPLLTVGVWMIARADRDARRPDPHPSPGPSPHA
jgi:uncharacterized membrane protein YkvI